MGKMRIDARAGIESTYVLSPFDLGKKALEEQGYGIVSLQEMAQLRMAAGPDSFISQSGNWVSEGVLHMPRKEFYLVRHSPIMDNAEEATNCHRNGKHFYPTDAQIDKALVESVKIHEEEIPFNRFGENEVTVFAFGKDAEKYGLFLKEFFEEALTMPVAVRDVGEPVSGRPYAKQMQILWMNYCRSALLGESRDLSYFDKKDCSSSFCRVRGVREFKAA